MAEQTGIQWCDATFNPWVGCEKVSPGCAHCYAETLVTGRMSRPGTWGADGTRERTSVSNWRKPLSWARKARDGRLPNGEPNRDGHRPRIFCASLADVFEPRPELGPWREELFALIHETPELDWLVLTKRPEFAREVLRHPMFWLGVNGRLLERGHAVLPGGMSDGSAARAALANVWLGTSIENARHTWRADVLRQIPAAVRFISAEPLLGSLIHPGDVTLDAAEGVKVTRNYETLGKRRPLDLTGIDWVIVGGESGHGARPFHLEHAREIRDACYDACPSECNCVDVDQCQGDRPRVFVKQLGARPVFTETIVGVSAVGPTFADANRPLNLLDRKGGDWTEWPADLRVREFPRGCSSVATYRPPVSRRIAERESEDA